MNLMFYNFNEFNINGPNPTNGRRPTASAANGKRPMVNGNTGSNTQGGMRTQNNFYKSKTLIEGEKKGGNTIQNQEQKQPINVIGP